MTSCLNSPFPSIFTIVLNSLIFFQRITIKTSRRKKIRLNLSEVGEIIDSGAVKLGKQLKKRRLIKQKSIKRMVSNMKRARLTLCLFI